MSKKFSILDLIKTLVMMRYTELGKKLPTDLEVEKAVRRVAEKNPALLYRLADKNNDGNKDHLGPVMREVFKYLIKN